MSAAGPRDVPTLTEVVEVAPAADTPAEPVAPGRADLPASPPPPAADAAPPSDDALPPAPSPAFSAAAEAPPPDAPPPPQANELLPAAATASPAAAAEAPPAQPEAAKEPAFDAAAATAGGAFESAVLPSEDQLARRILADLEVHIDLMLEYRLRELLTPLLARAADSLVRDARQEMASTLHAIVAGAVSRELDRHRGG